MMFTRRFCDMASSVKPSAMGRLPAKPVATIRSLPTPPRSVRWRTTFTARSDDSSQSRSG